MDQEEIQLQTTRLLTEHFGFQPITVIDDIINAINEIMYRCTEQLEQILINQKLKIDENLKNNNKDNNNKYSIEDIQIGTATLESFLEHNINRNFDKFEIYALRNIFNFPEDLITDGYIKLKNYEGLKLYDNINESDKKINEEMINIIQQIKYQVELNKILCESLPKLNKLRKVSKIIKIRLKSFLVCDNNNNNNNKILTQFMPLNDTIIFLVIELKNIFDKINSIKDLISDENLKNKFSKSSKEEEELNKRINLIIGSVKNNRNNDNKETIELSKINNQSSGNDIIELLSDERNIIL